MEPPPQRSRPYRAEGLTRDIIRASGMGAQMDQRRLGRGDQIIGVSGLVLFAVSFLDWVGGDGGRIMQAGTNQRLRERI